VSRVTGSIRFPLRPIRLGRWPLLREWAVRRGRLPGRCFLRWTLPHAPLAQAAVTTSRAGPWLRCPVSGEGRRCTCSGIPRRAEVLAAGGAWPRPGQAAPPLRPGGDRCLRLSYITERSVYQPGPGREKAAMTIPARASQLSPAERVPAATGRGTQHLLGSFPFTPGSAASRPGQCPAALAFAAPGAVRPGPGMPPSGFAGLGGRSPPTCTRWTRRRRPGGPRGLIPIPERSPADSLPCIQVRIPPPSHDRGPGRLASPVLAASMSDVSSAVASTGIRSG